MKPVDQTNKNFEVLLYLKAIGSKMFC